MEDYVYINGEMIAASEARVSAFDHGFLYGYGLFETMRAYHGDIFLLEQHMKRLHHGAGAIGLEEKLEGLDLAAACRKVVLANGHADARVRLTVTGGDAPGFPWEEPSGKPTVVISARGYRGFPPEKYAEGFRAIISTVRRCADSAVTGIKSVNYLISVLARREAAALGLDEAILLNDKGLIAEGGNSNLFFVKDGQLVTPTLGSGILPGITRNLVIELAQGAGIECREEEIKPVELDLYEEAFFTGSVIEIMPLVEVWMEDSPVMTIGDGIPGKVTRQLTEAYTARVKA